MARLAIPKNAQAEKRKSEVADALIEQYNHMAAHGGTDMFVIPKDDLMVILEALGVAATIIEE